MKIYAIKHDSASPTEFDLKAFSAELRDLSRRFGVKLVSLGAMAPVETAGKGATYVAIWSTEPNEN